MRTGIGRHRAAGAASETEIEADRATYPLERYEMELLRDVAHTLETLMAAPAVKVVLTGNEWAALGQSRSDVSTVLQRALANAVEPETTDNDGEDDDPQCICGTQRSEHALCGCPDGFQAATAEGWRS